MTAERRILLIVCLAGGLVALWLGFALEWDLLNYHLYNPHALLHGRHAIDLAPAQMQTFLNPALHLPLYLLFTWTHSAVPVFLTGAVQASQVLVLYLLLRELVDPDRCPAWMLLTVAALGAGGPIFLNQLGGSQGDTILSLPVLVALLVVLREQKAGQGGQRGEQRTGRRRGTLAAGLLAGFLLGLAAALKLTMAVYAVALTAAAFVMLPGARRWKVLGGLALGGALGVLLAGGPWFAWLWRTWDSPLFPYFNAFLQSPWVGESSYRDLRFVPETLAEWLFYPWVWFFEPLRVWEFRFRDLRVPLLFTLAFATPFFLRRWLRERRSPLVLVWVFVIVSYLLWLRLFSIYRYFSVVELLAPVLIFATAVALLRSRRAAVSIFVFLLITQALVKYDRQPSTWLLQSDAATAADSLPSDAMLVIGGFEPLAYTALWVDDAIPMIRIRANFMHTGEPIHRLQALAHERVRDHRGPRYLLVRGDGGNEPFIAEDLARVGLRTGDPVGDSSACRPFFDREELQRLLAARLCLLEPLDPLPGPDYESGSGSGSGSVSGGR